VSTLTNLESDLGTALAAESISELDASTRTEQLVARSALVASAQIVHAEEIALNSNVTTTLAEVVLRVVQRAAGSTLTQIESAEDLLRAELETLSAHSWWSALSSVRSGPAPEIETEAEPERIGECITFTLRARVALEV
jgi:fumarylacetoacetate (FAA) hydrolase family protein